MGDAGRVDERDRTVGAHIERLVGVYDAHGTWRGELAYWFGARLGRRHCSLCDITHGSVRERPEWIARKADLPVEFVTFHRDDQPDPVRAAADGRVPVVVADTDRGPIVLLAPDELEACEGSVDRLVDAVEAAVSRLGLVWQRPGPAV